MASAYLRPNPIQITIGGSGETLVANKDVAQSFVLVDGGEAATSRGLRQGGGRRVRRLRLEGDRLLQHEARLREAGVRAAAERLGRRRDPRRQGPVGARARASRSSPTARVDALRHRRRRARLDVKNVTHVINYDLPSGDDGTESVRASAAPAAPAQARAISLYLEKVDRKVGAALAPILRDAAQPVPDFIAEAEESCRRRGGGGRKRGKGAHRRQQQGRGGSSGGKGGRGKGGGGNSLEVVSQPTRGRRAHRAALLCFPIHVCRIRCSSTARRALCSRASSQRPVRSRHSTSDTQRRCGGGGRRRASSPAPLRAGDCVSAAATFCRSFSSHRSAFQSATRTEKLAEQGVLAERSSRAAGSDAVRPSAARALPAHARLHLDAPASPPCAARA